MKKPAAGKRTTRPSATTKGTRSEAGRIHPVAARYLELHYYPGLITLALACARLGFGAMVCHCDPPPCRVEALPPSPRSVSLSSMVRGAAVAADSAVGL